jgi:uncharacterized protein YllA (UPF0747 family)
MSSAAVETAGVVTRMENCSKHGPFPQVLFPTVPGQRAFWAGVCDGCAKDNELERQARLRIEARRDEIQRRVNERMAKLEKQIARETKERLEDYLREVKEEVAPQFDSYVRGERWNREQADVEGEMLDEELEKLKQLTSSGS